MLSFSFPFLQAKELQGVQASFSSMSRKMLLPRIPRYRLEKGGKRGIETYLLHDVLLLLFRHALEAFGDLVEEVLALERHVGR
jgi:hypothetical protein